MQKAANYKKARLLSIYVVILMVCISLLWFSFHFDEPIPTIAERSLHLPQRAIENSLMPIHLHIPTIDLKAGIQKVGLTKTGLMGVPNDPDHTGWYELGSYPGQVGSAVIDGHVDSPKGAAVFAELHKLEPGDIVMIQDVQAETLSFVVRETRIYDAQADTTEVFTSNDGKAHLNLITCGGVWDKASNSYPERLVVFTDKQ